MVLSSVERETRADLFMSQAKKIRILFACPDQLRKQQGRKELDALLDRKVAITDLEALGMIAHDDFKRIYWDPRIVPMWERATDAQSQDEDIVKAWFHFQLYRMDWKGAQKVRLIYLIPTHPEFTNSKNVSRTIGGYEVYEKLSGKKSTILLEHPLQSSCWS